MSEPRCMGDAPHAWGEVDLWGEGTRVRATQACATCGVVRVRVIDVVNDVDYVRYSNV